MHTPLDLSTTPPFIALKHHKLTAFHDPLASGLLSAESKESAEVVAVPKEAPVVKREVAAPDVPAVDATASEKTPLLSGPHVLPPGPTVLPPGPIVLPPICPGKKKHF